jgi:recombinational DNA repair protein (RecF pathway)
MKICIDCNQELPHSKFYIRNNRKIHIEPRCKDCASIKEKQYRKNNKEMIRAQNKRRVPGWDINRYNEYVELQGNRCAICATTNPLLSDWSADHDHATNQPRGLLCVRCNAGLGYFKDNPEYLQSAINYLSKWKSITTSHSAP